MTERAYWNEELETMPLDQLSRWQFEQLQKQLEYVYARTPHYQRVFKEASITPDAITSLDIFFEKIPFISKFDIIQNQKENPPFGELLSVDPSEIIRIFWAPGPETIYFTREDFPYTVDLGARTFFTNGVRSHDIVNITCTYHWVIAGTLQDAAYQRIGCAVIPGGAGMTQMHVEVMRLTGATAMFAFPTFAEEIGKVAREMGIDPARDLKIRLASISGEIRSEAMRKGLEETFGMVTRELYGTAEVPYVAAECPEGGGMHLEPRFIVEILDPATGKPVPPGEKGEVIVTDLFKRAQPVLRYRTGDITAGLNYEPCPCGRTTPRMGRILGRASDIPRVKGLFIVPKEVQEVIDRHPELGRFQMIIERPQTRDTLTIRIECLQPVDRARMRETLIKEFKDKIRITVDVEFVDEGTIPADAKVVDDRRMV